ncbi:MAG: 50S ribosomal protein L4 [Thermoprotei archaeon]
MQSLEKRVVPLFDMTGSESGTVEVTLPQPLSIRDDLILKAWIASQSRSAQPQGRSPEAGRGVSAVSWGTGRGISRVPRTETGRAAFISSAKGGHLAHPPRVEEKYKKSINEKEKELARLHALLSAFSFDKVRERGHLIPEKIKSLPIVVEDRIEEATKTIEVHTVLSNLGLNADVERAKKGTKIKSGRAKMRGRGKRVPKSLLIVVSRKDAPILRSGKNMPGVEVKYYKDLGIPSLAPGGQAGRLTLWSKSALQEVEKEWLTKAF